MVRKDLKCAFAAGISLSMLSLLVFLGLTGIAENMGKSAYGATMYDYGNRGGNTSSNSTTVMTTNETSLIHVAAVGQISSVQLDSNGMPAWIP